VRKRSGELWSVIAFAALCLNVFGRERPITAVQVSRDRFPLRFQSKPAAALLVGAHPQIRDKFALRHGRPAPIHKSMINLCTASTAEAAYSDCTGFPPRWVDISVHNAALTLCSCYVLSVRVTRGDVLRYGIAFALRRARKIVRGFKEALTEDERYAVADHVVSQRKEHGDPRKLSEEAKATPGPTT
jgi:hypothetical protein